MASTTPITHIVLFKYRQDITWAQLEEHFRGFKALQQKCLHPDTGRPYMLSMRMGKNLSWEPFSKGMTHAFVLEFASQAHLDYYLTQDAVHRAFSQAAGPLLEDSCVVDIQDANLLGPGFVHPDAQTAAGYAYHGKCHCGALGWRVTSDEVLSHVLCHCDTCKQLGGGPYSCNYIVPREALVVTKGEPGHYAYTGASGKQVHCYFCKTCTSHVYHHQDAMPEKVIVRTLLLDGGNDLKVGGEIFEEGRLGWVKDLQASLPDKKQVNGHR